MPLRRAKLFDAALASFLLVTLTAAPLLFRVGFSTVRYPGTTLEIARLALAASGWVPLLITCIILALSWYSGRTVDKFYTSTTSPRLLATILVALTTAIIACALLAASLVVSAADRQQEVGRIEWTLAFDAIAAAIVIWAGVSFGVLLLEVRAARRTLRETPQLDVGDVDPAISTTEYPSSQL